jgi:hypothetical protein
VMKRYFHTLYPFDGYPPPLAEPTIWTGKLSVAYECLLCILQIFGHSLVLRSFFLMLVVVHHPTYFM